MRFFKKLFFHSPFHYLISLGILIVYSVIYLAFRDFAVVLIPDAIISGGLLIMFLGLLFLCAYFGAFDTFAYAFSARRGNEKRKYDDLVDYTTSKQRERKLKDWFFMPYIVMGIIYMIIGFIINWIIR